MRSAFTGAFAPYICGLIEKKQALGYDYHGSACILRTFDEFCREQFPNETCLTAELAMKWAEQFKTEKNLSRLNRVSVIRELAKYMNSVGEQAYLLPLQLTKKSGRHIPYIYSKEDLSKLFKEIDSLQPSLIQAGAGAFSPVQGKGEKPIPDSTGETPAQPQGTLVCRFRSQYCGTGHGLCNLHSVVQAQCLPRFRDGADSLL